MTSDIPRGLWSPAHHLPFCCIPCLNEDCQHPVNNSFNCFSGQLYNFIEVTRIRLFCSRIFTIKIATIFKNVCAKFSNKVMPVCWWKQFRSGCYDYLPNYCKLSVTMCVVLVDPKGTHVSFHFLI